MFNNEEGWKDGEREGGFQESKRISQWVFQAVEELLREGGVGGREAQDDPGCSLGHRWRVTQEKVGPFFLQDIRKVTWVCCHLRVIALICTMARTWKQPKCPSADKWIKKMWCMHTMEYYSGIGRNFHSAICRYM